MGEFKRKYPHGAFDLGQECNQDGSNKSKELVTRNVSCDALHTMIMNAGITWVADWDRWIVPSELWTSQGFPITSEHIAITGVSTQFSRDQDPDLLSTRRSRNSQINQLGNTMHVNAIGAVLFAVLIRFPEIGVRSTSSSTATATASDAKQSYHSKLEKLLEERAKGKKRRQGKR
jgi:hypothetical protein